jgi:hypothetical protein
LIPGSTLLFGGGGVLPVITSQTADTRFLRRVLVVLVILTLVTGSLAAYTTVNAMTAQGIDLCQVTGFLCSN